MVEGVAAVVLSRLAGRTSPPRLFRVPRALTAGGRLVGGCRRRDCFNEHLIETDSSGGELSYALRSQG